MAHSDISLLIWFGSYRSKSGHRPTSGLSWLGQYLKSRVARRLLEHSALCVWWRLGFDHLRHASSPRLEPSDRLPAVAVTGA